MARNSTLARLHAQMKNLISNNARQMFPCSRGKHLGMFFEYDHYGYYLTCKICGALEEKDYFEVQELLKH